MSIPQSLEALLAILMDPTAEARDLPLSLFKDITGNFSDEHIIGRGGFGVVYKGMLQNGQRVAVKRLQAHMVDDTRFHTEVNFMKTLNHKNIVLFLAYCVHTEKVEYIKDNGEKDEAEIRERLLCFEYVPHGTIKEHIADESFGLEWPKRYQIIKGICDGLDYIHNVGGIVHLDIKPDNILLDDNMVPKIADFGLSRLVADYSKRTTKNKPGTLGYMAPEYMFYGKISRKADIFGLGRIIFELVTGSKGPETDEKDNFLEKVLTSWSKVLSTSHSGDSFKLAINQVEACIQIALNCTEHDRDNRLDIEDISNILQESSNCSPEKKVVLNHPGRSITYLLISATLAATNTYLLISATLAATNTYQAGLSTSGGFWPGSKDGDDHLAGDPLLGLHHPDRFKFFFYSNSTAFVASLVVIMLLMSRTVTRHGFRSCALWVCTGLDIVGLMGAFASGSCPWSPFSSTSTSPHSWSPFSSTSSSRPSCSCASPWTI